MQPGRETAGALAGRGDAQGVPGGAWQGLPGGVSRHPSGPRPDLSGRLAGVLQSLQAEQSRERARRRAEGMASFLLDRGRAEGAIGGVPDCHQGQPEAARRESTGRALGQQGETILRGEREWKHGEPRQVELRAQQQEHGAGRGRPEEGKEEGWVGLSRQPDAKANYTGRGQSQHGASGERLLVTGRGIAAWSRDAEPDTGHPARRGESHSTGTREGREPERQPQQETDGMLQGHQGTGRYPDVAGSTGGKGGTPGKAPASTAEKSSDRNSSSGRLGRVSMAVCEPRPLGNEEQAAVSDWDGRTLPGQQFWQHMVPIALQEPTGAGARLQEQLPRARASANDAPPVPENASASPRQHGIRPPPSSRPFHFGGAGGEALAVVRHGEGHQQSLSQEGSAAEEHHSVGREATRMPLVPAAAASSPVRLAGGNGSSARGLRNHRDGAQGRGPIVHTSAATCSNPRALVPAGGKGRWAEGGPPAGAGPESVPCWQPSISFLHPLFVRLAAEALEPETRRSRQLAQQGSVVERVRGTVAEMALAQEKGNTVRASAV